ncbi:MAG: RHS repeat-associated core domain-containing protein, partial [Planctomycetaceae bacterium]
TANNGTINERRYATQDGNWNTVAICDITGSVTERYAYSAYGTPVFMTGAGVVQSSSAVGFETLYAGYRFDGATPQMYYVRNRFLLPMIGTWNRRDPLGYVGDLNLQLYVRLQLIQKFDPFGLFDEIWKQRDLNLKEMPDDPWQKRPLRYCHRKCQATLCARFRLEVSTRSYSSLFEQRSSQFKLVVRIHVQHCNGCAANGCCADNVCTNKLKVICPDITSRVEERDYAGRLRISPRDVTGL